MFNISLIKSLPVVLLFFFLPISTAGSNIAFALAILLALFFLSLDWKDSKFTYLNKQPFLIYCLFFCYLLVSVFLVGSSSAGIFDGLQKYREIIFMPFLAFLISYQKDLTRVAIKAFLIAMGVTLFLSYLRGFGDVALFRHLNLEILLAKLGDKSNPTIFRWFLKNSN
jgi:hypothetical protein